MMCGYGSMMFLMFEKKNDLCETTTNVVLGIPAMLKFHKV